MSGSSGSVQKCARRGRQPDPRRVQEGPTEEVPDRVHRSERASEVVGLGWGWRPAVILVRDHGACTVGAAQRRWQCPVAAAGNARVSGLSSTNRALTVCTADVHLVSCAKSRVSWAGSSWGAGILFLAVPSSGAPAFLCSWALSPPQSVSEPVPCGHSSSDPHTPVPVPWGCV